MTPTQNPLALEACLSRGAWKAGMPGSEGAGTQQCVPATRRFTLKWRKTRGGGKWHCATMISDKSFRTIKQTVRNLTPRRSPRPLADVITEVNAALRGWTYYFRHALAGRRFSFLRFNTWNRIVSWQRELHRWNWTQVKRWLRRPDGSWRTITAGGIALFDPCKVRIERYWYRGTRAIPSPYPTTTA